MSISTKQFFHGSLPLVFKVTRISSVNQNSTHIKYLVQQFSKLKNLKIFSSLSYSKLTNVNKLFGEKSHRLLYL